MASLQDLFWKAFSVISFWLQKAFCVESMKVCKELKKGDTEGARKAVSMIVGRDTSVLDTAGITRAAVETVAENTSDGVIAPFLFMAIFGPVGGTFLQGSEYHGLHDRLYQ